MMIFIMKGKMKYDFSNLISLSKIVFVEIEIFFVKFFNNKLNI